MKYHILVLLGVMIIALTPKGIQQVSEWRQAHCIADQQIADHWLEITQAHCKTGYKLVKYRPNY
jgi:hypothetical protein